MLRTGEEISLPLMYFNNILTFRFIIEQKTRAWDLFHKHYPNLSTSLQKVQCMFSHKQKDQILHTP